ncbi:MAG TPA: hypothetical protein DCO86_04790 [Spirochaetaceae bacterium]|nr:hypothetical protein [Spirochaetaceae bacterium]
MRLLRNTTLFVSIAILLAYVVFTDGLSGVMTAFRTLDWFYFAIAAAVSFSSFFADALIVHFLRAKYRKDRYSKSLYNVLFVFASNNLIPATLQVGIAAETALLNSQGLKVSDAGSLVLYRQTVNFIAVTVFPLALVALSWDYFATHASVLLLVLFGAGLVIEALTSLFYAFVGTWSGFLMLIARFFIRIGCSLKLIGDKDAALEAAQKSIFDLKRQMSELPFGFSDGLIVFFFCILRNFLTFMSSFFIARALGVASHANFWTFIAAYSFVSIIPVVVPLPGGLGIADLTYVSIFSDMAGGSINMMMLLWRLMTFYFPAIVSIILMSAPMRGGKKVAGAEENAGEEKT